MAKNYKVRKKRSFGFHILRGILKIFIRKPKLINESGGELPEKAIYLMNHSGARGPLIFELYFPVRSSPWGAHEMCGRYKVRWNYLYKVFYQQKLHWNKVKAFFVATFFAIISKWIYNSIGLIGTYNDTRLLKTMRSSFAVLDSNLSVVIFPEDSTGGYLDKTPALNNGFIELSKLYYKRRGEDLPVYSVYYGRRKKVFVVDTMLRINQLLQEGKTEEEISRIFLEKNHALYDNYIV